MTKYIPKEGEYFDAVIKNGVGKGRVGIGCPCRVTGANKSDKYVTSINATDSNGCARSFSTFDWSFRGVKNADN